MIGGRKNAVEKRRFSFNFVVDQIECGSLPHWLFLILHNFQPLEMQSISQCLSFLSNKWERKSTSLETFHTISTNEIVLRLRSTFDEYRKVSLLYYLYGLNRVDNPFYGSTIFSRFLVRVLEYLLLTEWA